MNLSQIKQNAAKDTKKAKTTDELEDVRVKYLGRKGAVAELFSGLVKLKGEKRKKMGKELNQLKGDIENEIVNREKDLQAEHLSRFAEKEKLDVTLPGTVLPEGHLHITTHAIEETMRIFSQLGFRRMRYPEIDWDYYAFETLNMPKEHAARDEWETFFIDAQVDSKMGKQVLIPHTSNGQVREMERRRPPIRIINIAKCYRRQSDVSHTPMFHQVEGLLIDKDVSVTHLKGTLDYFARAFFGPNRKTRLRPFHFRFTEPSFEVDVSCGICGGTGINDNQKCKVCKSGWHELGGAGMVNPNVLRSGKLDPKVWKGFAFGWGIERTYMMKEGLRIADLRTFYNNDLSFLEQF
jgi:phenylalanyl-tRNA synthetase alpha chain